MIVTITAKAKDLHSEITLYAKYIPPRTTPIAPVMYLLATGNLFFIATQTPNKNNMKSKLPPRPS